VAAASILARAYALNQLKELSKKAKFSIPKGSTHVKHALEKIKKFNLDPREYVKLNFSNVKKFFKEVI
jgi:ribonuclease HIII